MAALMLPFRATALLRTRLGLCKVRLADGVDSAGEVLVAFPAFEAVEQQRCEVASNVVDGLQT